MIAASSFHGSHSLHISRMHLKTDWFCVAQNRAEGRDCKQRIARKLPSVVVWVVFEDELSLKPIMADSSFTVTHRLAVQHNEFEACRDQHLHDGTERIGGHGEASGYGRVTQVDIAHAERPLFVLLWGLRSSSSAMCRHTISYHL